MLKRLYPSEKYPIKREDFVDDTYNVIYFSSAALNWLC